MKPSAMALITSAGGSAEIIERHSEKWNTRGGSGSAAAIEANQESMDIPPPHLFFTEKASALELYMFRINHDASQTPFTRKFDWLLNYGGLLRVPSTGDGRIACPVPGDAAKLVARQG